MADEVLGGSRDVTPDQPLNPATFDIAAFVAGVKPTRRAVTIYARGDLKAALDRLSDDIDKAEKAGRTDEAAELRRDAAAVVEEMSAPGAVVDVIVEGRSDDWVSRFDAELDAQKITDETERIVRRVAAQIVEPAGFTYELLEQLRQVSEPQVKKIVVAAQMANVQPAGVDASFLRNASGSNKTRG